MHTELASRHSAQAKSIASMIRQVDPDVLLILELDKTANLDVLTLFHDLYIKEHDSTGYPYRYHFESNTGEDTGLDLDRNGRLGDPGDAQGFGRHPGQYAFALLARVPFQRAGIHQFRSLLWGDFEDSRILQVRRNGQPWYTDAARRLQRLSSKNHVAVPLMVREQIVWLFAAHPTPPVFDGDEDRNGHRNYDEIRLLKRLIGGSKSVSSDANTAFKLSPNTPFVVMGDLNADPVKGDAVPGAISQLLAHPSIHPDAATGSLVPALAGADDRDRHNTSTFGLRVDYILPSRGIKVWQSGLCESRKVGGKAASDHHLVWMDLDVVP